MTDILNLTKDYSKNHDGLGSSWIGFDAVER